METSKHKELISKAIYYLSNFELASRSTRETYYRIKNDASDSIRAFVYLVHNTNAPDDFVYDTIVEALSAISECSNLDEIELEPNQYYSDLVVWLGSHMRRSDYCDRAPSTFDLVDPSIVDLLSYGQRLEKKEILASVLRLLC